MSNAAEKLDIEALAVRLNSTRLRARERRRFRRLPVVVDGRLLDTAGREHDCRTADISPGDVRIVSPTPPQVGERVVLYLAGLGRVSGHVARTCGPGEVAIIFDFSVHKREKLTEQLTLAINKDLGVTVERAKAPSSARIETETGESYEGEVVDFSLAGISIKSSKPAPLIGAWVRVGGVYGRVARLIEGGFAIDFDPRAPR